MSALPEAENFKAYTFEFSKTHRFSIPNSTNEMDLDRYHQNLIAAKRKQLKLVQNGEVVVNPIDLSYELFSTKFLESFECSVFSVFDKHIGYSKKHKSLSVSLIEDGRTKTIAIRHSYTQEGKLIKWKTYGSKTYVPHKIKDDYIFVAVGMAEFILFEMMQVSYVLLQSDSVYRHIPPGVISLSQGKNIIVLKENDESFNKLILELQRIFVGSIVFVIDFEIVLGKQLKKGFDIRDFCNEISDINIVEQKIEHELLKQVKDKK
ncbi:MAG: hypothetical protein AB7S65_00020 [Sulfuricurvum sp.]